MVAIAIGRTFSGKDIRIGAILEDAVTIFQRFDGYSERDLFDIVLACEALQLKELLRGSHDVPWIEALERHAHILAQRLGEQEFTDWKAALGLISAFEARDYGRQLLFAGFR